MEKEVQGQSPCPSGTCRGPRSPWHAWR